MIRKENVKPALETKDATENKAVATDKPKQLAILTEAELLAANAGKWYDWSKWD